MKTQIFYFSILISIILTSCNLGYDVDSDKVTFNYWSARDGIKPSSFEIEEADPISFKILENNRFATDLNYCYYEGKIIVGADPKTFKSLTKVYAKDSSFAYYDGIKINGAIGETFEVINEGPYSKDGNDYYLDTNKINVSDYSSFQILNKTEKYGLWAKDSNFYYIGKSKYHIEDYESFEVIGNGFAKDKFRVYFNDTFLINADPLTFIPVTDARYGIGRDKFNIYYGERIIDSVELKRYKK